MATMEQSSSIGPLHSDAILLNSKQVAEILSTIRENLTKSLSKNDSLLEAIESSEVRATQTGSNEAPLLRNLRARLAAAHAPYSALRRDLNTFSGIFEKRCKELESAMQANAALKKQLTHENHDLEARIASYEQERTKFEEERAEWKEESERAQEDIIEQNDRLTVLSQRLSGAKSELDATKNELASQRIAFEEEKLARSDDTDGADDSEAESLRIKLKQQVIRNVELENALLRNELSLYQKEENIKELELRNSRFQQDICQKKMASSRAVHQFESRIAEANKKLTHMNSELVKSQEHARRFQDLLGNERRKQKGLKHALEQELQRKSSGVGAAGDGLTPAGQKAYIETLAQTLSAPTKPHPAKAEDVVRKSESVIVENASMKAEIRKLRIENNDLMKRVRFADINAQYMRNQVAASIADRVELMKRLDKAEAQYHDLERSLTKQASEWVALKKRESKTEKSAKWSQIQPIPVLGASERTWNSASGKGQVIARSAQVRR